MWRSFTITAPTRLPVQSARRRTASAIPMKYSCASGRGDRIIGGAAASALAQVALAQDRRVVVDVAGHHPGERANADLLVVRLPAAERRVRVQAAQQRQGRE